MARCRLCGNKSEIFLKEHRLPLCINCYPKWFLKIVKRTIDEWQMFSKDDKILVAVSGGKDSVAVWYCLSELGYNVSGVHVVISSTEYSIKSKEYFIDVAKTIKSQFNIIDIKDEFSYYVDEISSKLKRKPCLLCSIIKRRLLNRFAFENNYDVVVTGHNLDDESAALLGNVLRWDLKYLLNQMPVLEKKDNFVRKVKPFIRFTDDEIRLFCQIKGLKFVGDRCPFSSGAHSIIYKDLFKIIEEEMPPAKWMFYSNFVKNVQKILRTVKEEEDVLNKCEVCSYPTTKKVCSFCLIKEKLRLSQ